MSLAVTEAAVQPQAPVGEGEVVPRLKTEEEVLADEVCACPVCAAW